MSLENCEGATGLTSQYGKPGPWVRAHRLLEQLEPQIVFMSKERLRSSTNIQENPKGRQSHTLGQGSRGLFDFPVVVGEPRTPAKPAK